jgi:peptide/nickel transport system permease protein
MSKPATIPHRTQARKWLLVDEPLSARQARMQQGYLGWLRLRRQPTALAGLAIVGLLLTVAIGAPLLARWPPLEQNMGLRLSPPGSGHWFGTDQFGRDIFSRIVYGARTTLYIAGLVAAIAGPIGLAVGTLAGYAGGMVESFLMRITDLFLAFPALILSLAFVAALGPGIQNAVIAIALTAWPPIARLARAETLSIRLSDYISASRMLGAGPCRMVFHHILPMCLPSVIVRISFNMAAIILVAAGLGFLGMGAQPPQPEWGAMLSSGQQYIFQSWWIAAFPGLAIMTASLGFNLLGDGLRDVLDPRGT